MKLKILNKKICLNIVASRFCLLVMIHEGLRAEFMRTRLPRFPRQREMSVSASYNDRFSTVLRPVSPLNHLLRYRYVNAFNGSPLMTLKIEINTSRPHVAT